MQFCPKCGAAWRQNANFCTSCGYRLSANVDAPGAGFLDPEASAAKKQSGKKRKQLSAGSRAVRSIVSVLLCLLLFALLTGGMALASVRIATSRLAVGAALETLDISKAYLGEEGGMTIADELVAELAGDAVAYYDISREDMASFYEKSTLRPFLADKLADFAAGVFDGSSKRAVVTADEIAEVVMDNAELIEEELGYPIDETDYALIRQSAVDALGGEELRLDDEMIADGVDAAMLRVMRGVFSWWTITLVFAAALACAAGIFFLWFRYFVPFSRFVGVPAVIAGALYLLLAAGILAMPALIHELEGASQELLNAAFCPGGIGIGLMALLTLLVGAFLLAAGTRVRKKEKLA